MHNLYDITTPFNSDGTMYKWNWASISIFMDVFFSCFITLTIRQHTNAQMVTDTLANTVKEMAVVIDEKSA